MAADVAEYVLTSLKNTSAVTDLVMGGANNIYESGDLWLETLQDVEKDRREGGNPGKVLAVVVQDAGARIKDEARHVQNVDIYIYDRERGYTNIRALRKQIYLALQGRATALTGPYQDHTTMTPLQFQTRTGHRVERRMAVEYEGMRFQCEVHMDLP